MPYSPFQITIQTGTPHILLCQGLHFAMHGWLLCSRSRTFPQRVGGTITLFPHKMHLSSTLTLAPVNIGSTVDIPWNHLCGPTITTVLRILDRTGSQSVCDHMWVVDTGDAARWSIRITISTGCGVSAGASASGSWLRASALACSFPALYRNAVGVCAITHHWILPDAIRGTALDSYVVPWSWVFTGLHRSSLGSTGLHWCP